MHDKYGNPLAVGDSVWLDAKDGCPGGTGAIATIRVRGDFPSNFDAPCRHCGSSAVATIKALGGAACGCIITKIDGTHADEETHQEAIA